MPAGPRFALSAFSGLPIRYSKTLTWKTRTSQKLKSKDISWRKKLTFGSLMTITVRALNIV